ncbi:MAG: DUF1922 domain-containing protein [Candidatus Bathyarchaeota archaeon]|nr:MAG: DUF1922 domain-containing protein [Candidatus Bathyarchaeota archaeon]
MYLVVACPKCGHLFVAAAGQQSRTCPFCTARVRLMKAKRLGKADTAREASVLAQHLKHGKMGKDK